MTGANMAASQSPGAAPTALDLDGYVPFFLNTLSNKISAGASQVYLRDFRIGITEWRLLAVLGARPGLNANGIAAYTGMDKSVVSRALRALELQRLVDVSVDAADHRRRSLELTQKGWELRGRVQGVALEREERLLAGLSPAERSELLRMLHVLLGNVAQLDAAPESGR